MRTFTLLFVFALLLSAVPVSAGDLHPVSTNVDSKMERMIYLKNMSDKMHALFDVERTAILKGALLSHKLDSIVSEVRGSVAESWKKDWKSEFSYTGSLNNQWIESSWDGEMLKWNIDSRTEWSYNDDGMVESMTMYAILEGGTSLEKSTVLKVQYDDQDRVKTVIYEEDVEGVWGEALKQDYNYNSSGKISHLDSYSMESGSWLLIMKNQYEHNASGHLTGMNLIFIEEGEEMIFTSTIYTVDANGRVLTDETSMLDFFTFELVKFSKTEYVYTVNGDVSVVMDWVWNKEGSVWNAEYKQEYSYNNSISMENVQFPSFFNILGQLEAEMLAFHKMPTEILYYDYVDGAYVNLEKETYFYSEINTTIASTVKEKGYAIFPVPANEEIVFTWGGDQKPMLLEIFDIDGRLVANRQVKAMIPVDVSSLREGLYVFRLHDGKRIAHTGKLVIQR